MKRIMFLLLFLNIAFSASSNNEPKYKRGDCITPTDNTYSWFGKYARVEGVGSIDGFSGKTYALLFMNYQSNSTIFSKSIERSTKNVERVLCNIDKYMLHTNKTESTATLQKGDLLKFVIASYIHGFNEFDTSINASENFVSISIYFAPSAQQKNRAEQLAKRFKVQIPLMLKQYSWGSDVEIAVQVYGEDRIKRGY